jgi:protease-4
MKKAFFYSIFLTLFITSAISAQGLFDIFSPPAGKVVNGKYKVKFIEGDEEADEEVLLIKIRGVIQEKPDEQSLPFERKKDLLKTIKKDLELAKNREAVKAIILDINSPGGEVTASDIIYHQLSKFQKETKKPIVAIFGTLGASGAYYVACAANKILAHPTSIIGSIGVIMNTMNLKRLVENIGIKPVVLKSERTPKKDILSPFKDMTKPEETMLLEIVNGIYDRFVKIVSKSRNKTKEEIMKIADGGIYNSDKALKIGLIDKIGYREDAMEVACQLAKIKSAALVKRYQKRTLSDILSGMAEMNSGAPAIMQKLQTVIEAAGTPSLMYKINLK